MSKINNFAAFEVIKNVMPKARLDQLFTACRDLDKERKGLYEEIEAEKTKQTKRDKGPDKTIKPSLTKSASWPSLINKSINL